MKNLVLGAAAAAAGLGIATAASAQTYGDVARVVSATPIKERVVTPRRECHTERITAYEVHRSAVPEDYAPPRPGIGAGTVLGAIVGGVIGHQFGSSSAGRDHGTAAGAIVGGLVGNQIDRDAAAADAPPPEVVEDRVPVTRDVQRCNDIADATERVVAYDVRYEYNGHEFRTRLPYDPGEQMAVNVDVRPPSGGPSAAPPYRAPAPVGPTTPSYRPY